MSEEKKSLEELDRDFGKQLVRGLFAAWWALVVMGLIVGLMTGEFVLLLGTAIALGMAAAVWFGWWVTGWFIK